MRDLEWWQVKAGSYPPKPCAHCRAANVRAHYFPVNREGQIIAYKCPYCGEEELVVSKPQSSPIRYHAFERSNRKGKANV